MNIFNLLAKDKDVAGIEIDESVIRIALFRSKKKPSFIASFHHDINLTAEEKELILFEESLPSGLVKEGAVVDPLALGKALQGLLVKARIHSPYAIVAIPDDKIYSRIFTFPKALDEARVGEAMNLASSFQLPFGQEDIYSDWEIIGASDTSHEVLFSATLKDVTRGFVTALAIAGIKPLALESHLDSIARATESDPGVPSLYTKETSENASIFIVKDNYVRFSRAIPNRFISKNKFKTEVQKVKTAFEASGDAAFLALKVENIEKVPMKSEYAQFEKLNERPSDWFVALGAAIRGSIPDGDDTLISLLPVKTEEAYTYQKAATFVVLLRNITIGIALFFTFSFFAMYFVMLSLSQTANQSIASLSSAPVSSEVLAHETTVKNVNELTTTAKLILSETPLWSSFLEEFSLRTIPGITITNLSSQSILGELSIAGSAQNRSTLNEYKKSLQESPLFTEVQLPITNLEQKENIAFSITFKIKEPAKLYYK